MKHYLLFDLGTGNTRVAIVTSDGTIVDIRTVTNYYLKDDAYEDAQYFLPAEWEEKIQAFPDCRKELKTIERAFNKYIWRTEQPAGIGEERDPGVDRDTVPDR